MNNIEKSEFSLLYRDMFHYRLKNNLVELNDFFKKMFSIVNDDDNTNIFNPLIFVMRNVSDDGDIDMDILYHENDLVTNLPVEFFSHYTINPGLSVELKPDYRYNFDIAMNKITKIFDKKNYEPRSYPTIILFKSKNKVIVKLWVSVIEIGDQNGI